MAISGITTSCAIIAFASSLGRWVDHAPSRLQTLLTTVSINRVVVISACVCWATIVIKDAKEEFPTPTDGTTEVIDPRPLKLHQWKDALFLLILALGILERLSRLANLVCIERDWVPTLATVSSPNQSTSPYDLSRLNAAMSRIDLICKLGSPIAISAFMSATGSPSLGAALLIGFNLLTWPFEYWTAKSVWQGNEQLRKAKVVDVSEVRILVSGGRNHGAGFSLNVLYDTFQATYGWVVEYRRSLAQYFTTEVWMPSLAIAGLHFSILTFSSTLIVFLVNSGFSMTLITWAEVLSAVFEMTSTFIFPWAVRALGNQRTGYHPLPDNDATNPPASPSRSTFEIHNDIATKDDTSLDHTQTTGISKLGLLAISLTLLCLIPSLPALWHISSWPTVPKTHTAWQSHIPLTTLVIISVSASRLGRFTSALCAQQLAQSRVQPGERSTFAGTEASLASTFGLAHFLATAVWSSHGEFRWIALSSVVVVAAGVGLYAFWLLRGLGGRLV